MQDGKLIFCDDSIKENIEKGWPFHALWTWEWSGYVQTFTLCVINTGERSGKKDNNKVKTSLTPSPTHQTSTQAQPLTNRKGGRRTPPPLNPRMGKIDRAKMLKNHHNVENNERENENVVHVFEIILKCK